MMVVSQQERWKGWQEGGMGRGQVANGGEAALVGRSCPMMDAIGNASATYIFTTSQTDPAVQVSAYL